MSASDLQGPAQRFCEDVALWAEIPSNTGAALPLRPSFPAHWAVWVLPASRGCPGVLSINYAEEMNQLDIVRGEPGDLWQACCPEQKRESIKGETVCWGFFGNSAGQLFELLGQNLDRLQNACLPLSPSCSRLWTRWVVWEPSGEGSETYLGSSASFREATQTSPDPCGIYPSFVLLMSSLKMETWGSVGESQSSEQ